MKHSLNWTLAISGLALVLAIWAVARTNPGASEEAPAGPQFADLPPSDPADGLSELESIADATEDNEAPASSSPQPHSDPTIQLPLMAISASKEEMESEAQMVVDNLVSAMPGQAVAMHVKAVYHAQIFETEKAEKLWTECIKISPDTEPYYVNLAAIAIDRGENELAIDVLQKAHARGLHSSDLSHHLTVALTNAGRLEEAIEVAQSALAVLPNSASHWLLLGQAQLKLGDSESAEANLKRAIQLGAATKSAYFALFNACIRNGKREEAEEYRQTYLGFEPEEQLYGRNRYHARAESKARQVLLTILGESALLYQRNGQSNEAELLLLRILALEPRNLTALEQLSEIYESQNRPADQKAVRERQLTLSPTSLIAYLQLARAEANAGQPEAAEGTIKLAISMAPQTVMGYAAMTDFLLERQQPERALWYVQQAIDIQPSREGYLLLAKTLRFLGRESEAQAAEAEGLKL